MTQEAYLECETPNPTGALPQHSTLSGWEALGGCWKVSKCRPGKKLWVTQASRDVTKTGMGPHQPTVPEICSPRQRACSVRQRWDQGWVVLKGWNHWGVGRAGAVGWGQVDMIRWGRVTSQCPGRVLTHQAVGGSSHCAHTSPGHQAPLVEQWSC